ncbi:carbohydrate kinase [Hymenobacter sp. HMF4947]|uniref:Carbohydrate kinase n=1 Tax=Hymenobacter ginkgonis TaxID=2682976 RepID=A0A7K1T8R2_9BACT|nr:carbohydrate kinase [Hymenobacter ginkgonis]MVN74796.1 carbohydrate kinase [Hymenobacter ginkgonis]
MAAPIVCFGEILWDMLPTGKQPGGAPFNVAVHLHQLGVPAQLISRVGDDELGTELLDFMTSKGLATSYVQRGHSHLTGVVKANVDDRQEVSYKIVQPVAWDYIQPAPELAELVAGAAMLVFGSLAARSPATRDTLLQLLPQARYRVFDVNLRPPHYTRRTVEHLLGQATMVKLNHHELAELLGWQGQAALPDAEALPYLARVFGLEAVCLTRGADGAALWTKGAFYESPGFVVEVQDTIGSGDAFLAALLRGWLAGQPPAECLRTACALGALVAAQAGATPLITPEALAAQLAAG